MASICNSCAESRKGEARPWPVGAWQGQCTFCQEHTICTDTRDWCLDEEGKPLPKMTQQQAIAALFKAEADAVLVEGMRARRARARGIIPADV